MKTLIITLEYPPQVGGIASYVYNLAANMPAGDSFVYAPQMPGDKEFDQKNTWITYRRRPFWLIWPRWLKMYWQVSKIVKTEKIEQIYVHHVLPVGYVAWLIKKIRKIPYTIFLHGTDVALAGRRLKINQFRFICKNAGQVVVNSEYLSNQVLARAPGLANIFILNPSPSNIFAEPLNEEKLNKLAREAGTAGHRVLVSASRLAPEKGQDLLLKYFSKVLYSYPDAVLVLIGDGPERENLNKLADSLGVAPSVRFVGNVPLGDLPYYYRLGDVFLLFTHPFNGREESWGTAFLEAAMLGLPVIAGRSGGVGEAVLDGTTGILVNVESENETLTAINKLLSDPSLADRLGAAGRERALKEFIWKEQLKKLGV